MAILKVARLGHPVLRQVAKPVPEGEIASSPVQGFIDDLIETMTEYDGTGLAAPQVHVSRRIFVYKVETEPGATPEVPPTALINPVLTPATENTEVGWEGCLSLPDLRGLVRRAKAVRVQALDRQGKRLDFTAKDFHARVIQHEHDHLDGIVYVDRMDDMSSLSFLDEFTRYGDY
jgi:peptide deformylase